MVVIWNGYDYSLFCNVLSKAPDLEV